jgi:hypothetical protein
VSVLRSYSQRKILMQKYHPQNLGADLCLFKPPSIVDAKSLKNAALDWLVFNNNLMVSVNGWTTKTILFARESDN